MHKTGLILRGTVISALILFAVELLSFLLFNDLYSSTINAGLITQKPWVFILKLLIVNIIIGFLISSIFDFFYIMLPGGFLKKALYFTFVLFILSTVIWLLNFLIIFNLNLNFFFLLLLEYMMLDFIIALILVGIYNEYFMKQTKLKKDQEIKPETVKSDSTLNNKEVKNDGKSNSSDSTKPA